MLCTALHSKAVLFGKLQIMCFCAIYRLRLMGYAKLYGALKVWTNQGIPSSLGSSAIHTLLPPPPSYCSAYKNDFGHTRDILVNGSGHTELKKAYLYEL